MKIKKLTEGKINKLVFTLAMPMLLNGLLELTYNLVDMFWIAKINSKSVASIGTAGLFIWIGFTLAQLATVGTQIRASQEIGNRDFNKSLNYQGRGLQLGLFIGIIYGIMLISFNGELISIFKLKDKYVIDNATSFLYIIGLYMPFTFMNLVYATIYNAKGLGSIPLKISGIAILMNMCLDPLLIFKFNMGVEGAGIATLIATITQFTIYTVYTLKKENIIKKNLFNTLDFKIKKEILKLGIPPFLLNFTHASTSVFITAIVSKFGSDAIAVQKVGSQIESISWGTAIALSIAISTFVGQNIGAKKYNRVKKGYNVTFKMSLAISSIVVILFLFTPKILLKPFFGTDSSIILLGVDYFRILSVAIFFQSVEIMTSGAFNGLGKTIKPAIISVSSNIIRIPLAIYLSKDNILGLNGIWWAITITSVVKGVIMYIAYKITVYKLFKSKINEKRR